MSIPSNEVLKSAFGGMFAVSQGYLMVDPGKLEILPGYNAKKPYDPKNNETDARLTRMIQHNGFDPTFPILVGVNLANKKAYVIRGHSRVAIARAMKASNHEKAPSRIACTLVDPAQWSEARLQADVSHSNFGRGQNPAEMGLTILRMVAAGDTRAEIEAALGLSRKSYDAAVKLAKADDMLKDAVKTGFIMPTLLAKLVATYGEEKTKAILTDAKATGATKGKGKVTASTLKPSEAKVTGKTTIADRIGGTGVGSGRKPRTPIVPATPAVVVAPTRADTGATAYAEGPFKVGTREGEILDSKGFGIASADGNPMARFIVDGLNAAYRAELLPVPGKPKASGNVVPMVAPGKPVAVAVKAAAARTTSTRKAGKRS